MFAEILQKPRHCSGLTTGFLQKQFVKMINLVSFWTSIACSANVKRIYSSFGLLRFVQFCMHTFFSQAYSTFFTNEKIYKIMSCLVLSPFPPNPTAGAVVGQLCRGVCAKSFGSVRVFGVTSLWDQPFEFWDQMGKQVVKTLQDVHSQFFVT